MASYNLLFHVQSMKQRLLLLKLISCSSTLLLDILPILGMAAMQTFMMSKAGDGDATQGAKHFQKRKRWFSFLGYCCKKLCLLRFSISKAVSIKNVNLAEAGSLAIDEFLSQWENTANLLVPCPGGIRRGKQRTVFKPSQQDWALVFQHFSPAAYIPERHRCFFHVLCKQR